MLSALNLDYPEWYDLFANKPLVDALLDRLRHHCITIHIDGPSLREPLPTNADSPPANVMSPPTRVRQAKTPPPKRA
jgi:hypothetical protein